MNAFGRLVLLGIALVLSGCATTQYFAPSPRVGQRKVYLPSNRNILGVDETRSDGVVEVYMVPTVGDPLFNGTVSFWVYVQNKSPNTYYFGIDDIAVRDKDGRSLTVLTPNQVADQLRGNTSAQQFQYALVSSMITALAEAPFAYERTTGTVSGYTSNGQYVTGTYQTVTPNTTAQYMAQQQNQSSIDQFNAQSQTALARDMEWLQRMSFKSALLKPNYRVKGLVSVPLRSGWSLPNRYEFTISLGNSAFTVDFLVQSTK